MTAKWRGRPLRMAFLLVPQYSMMAFSGAIEPLRSANRMAERQLFEWRLVSADGDPVVASNGIAISVHESIDQVRQADMLVVCAGLDPIQFGRGHKIHHHLRRLARHGSMVGAVSTGTFILADAGLLGDRRCTVHWEYLDLFRSRYPALNVSQDLFIVDREIFTCSGGTATLDMMLHFVSESSGPQLALAVAEQLMHPQIRSPADQQRLGLHSRYGIDSLKLVEIIHLMEMSIDRPVDVTDIAGRVGISARQTGASFS